MSEQTEFLKDLEPTAADILNKNLTDETVVPETVETEEESEMKLKNRREKRLADKWQAERESNIALTARLEAITETRKTDGEEADYLKRIKSIYGDATPEAKEATNILVEALQGLEKTAVDKAFTKLQSEKEAEIRAQKQEEKNLDEVAERVEEDHGIDMSVDANRKGYFALMEKLSPKDRDGNITEYADPDAVAEVFLSTRERTSSRAKDLASRSMTRSGQSQPSAIQDDAAVRFLKENGII